jgi:hypothetical protein
MSHQLSDYLKAINETKEPLMDTPEWGKPSYPPFVVGRCLSYFPDTLFAVNEMNTRAHIDPKMHFDFLRVAVRKRKRFSKWLKRENDERVQALIEYYGFSAKKAREALTVLTETQVSQIMDAVSKGGKP